ncbi:hypothetical protein ACFL6S_18270 [Candidatus Poribacteria bacterium]
MGIRTSTGLVTTPETRLTPLRSIRKFCVDDCCLGQIKEARLCPSIDCALHPYRFGRGPEEKPRLTPLKSIKARCLDCSNHSPKEVRECWNTACVLYPYRMGRNPNLKGKRKGNADALRRWREAQASETAVDEKSLYTRCNSETFL